jgi:hypothetical protein
LNPKHATRPCDWFSRPRNSLATDSHIPNFTKRAAGFGENKKRSAFERLSSREIAMAASLLIGPTWLAAVHIRRISQRTLYRNLTGGLKRACFTSFVLLFSEKWRGIFRRNIAVYVENSEYSLRSLET